MTAEAFASFLALPEQDRRDVFTAASRRLGTAPDYVEKDFWVCLVLNLLFNALPEGHPKLLFKGGTSLSKAFGLIRRFSEDIDVVVHRDALGFAGDRDPKASSADIPLPCIGGRRASATVAQPSNARRPRRQAACS